MIQKVVVGFVVVVVAFFLLAVGAVLSSHLWLGQALAMGIENMTGFPTKIGRTNLSLGESRIGINGIEIKNPKGFPEGVFASIPEIYVDFDLDQFLKNRKFYFQEIRLNIEEVAIIRNQSGETNLSRLKPVSKPKAEMVQEQREIKKAPSPKALNFFVEKLVLSIRRVRYRDESRPLVGERTVDLHMNNQVFTGIANPKDIVRIIVLQITYKAALGNLGVPVDMLKGHLDESLAVGQKLALQSTLFARQMGTQTLGEGMRFIEGASGKIPVASGGVEKTVDEVTNTAKGLLGSATRFLQGESDSPQETQSSPT
ncbi:MAG: hypothetical protein HY584_04935 [Candidatus Omnitrophica bacterium]|nr:hypothetical protein [Candidatus Omnitrophota bacterium]